MRVLIIGGGGREHALAWKMAQSSRLDRLYCLPGNAGIAALADCPEVDRMEEGEVLRWSLDRKIRLVVFGPEAQLVAGWADGFRKAGLLAFGPGAEGAALEGSKVWAKQFMAAHKIPTAPFVVAGSYDEARRLLEQRDEGPVVVKADGLAAGKGVIVARNLAEAEEALDKIMKERAFGSAGERVVIEECLSGEEASVLAITDGSRLLVLPAAQDHKAIGEGDRGPNTGGMGSYSPAPVVDAELASQVEERVFRPLLKGLAQRGIDYRGVIYAGLMIRDREINVLEFNVRFGDPETQALMPRLDADLLPILEAAARGRPRRGGGRLEGGGGGLRGYGLRGLPGEVPHRGGNPRPGEAEGGELGSRIPCRDRLGAGKAGHRRRAGAGSHRLGPEPGARRGEGLPGGGEDRVSGMLLPPGYCSPGPEIKGTGQTDPCACIRRRGVSLFTGERDRPFFMGSFFMGSGLEL